MTEMLIISKSDVRVWMEELNGRLADVINGITPEGFEPIAQWDYDYKSVRLREILHDTNEAGVYPCFVFVDYSATRREITQDGFETRKFIGVVEIPVWSDKTLDLSYVDFFDGFIIE